MTGASPTRSNAAALVSDDSPDDDGPRYSIRVTSRMTAIELDTLRMWERRYGFPRPARTPGGSRVYRQADVDALKLIRSALDHGYRPGEIVGKTREELHELLSAASQPGRARPEPGVAGAEAVSPTIASLLDALLRDDVAALRAGLRHAAIVLGPKRFLVDVVHPLSVRVGEMWAEGKLEVFHEHLLSECLSAQLRVLMAAYDERPGAPRVLLATLPNERHGLGLHMIEVYLAASHVTPVLVGVDTPAEQIVKAARMHQADAVGLLVTQASDLVATARDIAWMLGELGERANVWVGGAAGPDLRLQHAGLTVATTWGALDAAIAKLTPASK